ncbi:MAG: Diguanylate cyclase VdcA [Gammaproteobacteria bacterium]|nr:Diguanylate cyclase VdcA [Gammaproteobacteria bacterium]
MTRKYEETKAASGEILRMVVPAMAGHNAACHPISYTVWYEYFSGRNPRLRAELDPRLQRGEILEEGDIAQLFERHLTGPHETTVRRLCEELRQLAGEISASARQAGAEAGEYAQSLDAAGQRLETLGEHPELEPLIRELLEGAARMRRSVGTLEDRLAASGRQINELREALAQAQNEALIDPLTGLVNRRGFDSALHDLIESPRTGEAGTCLLMVDIDHFKRINDAHGHLVGDKVIRAVAQVLKNGVKGRDTVARYGGEEFSVLLPATPLAGACALAEQLRVTVERGRIRRADNGEAVASVTISIGVTALHAGEPFEEFVQRADAALYASKQNGRNRVTARPFGASSAAVA